MPDGMDFLFRRLILFLFEDIFSILFYTMFPNFKVLDMILDGVGHNLPVRAKVQDILEEFCTFWYCCDRDTRHACRKIRSALNSSYGVL
jgi:hypothetical protein